MSTATAHAPSPGAATPPPLAGMQATADALGVHYLTLRKMTKRGDVPYFIVGNQYKFDIAAVLDALRGRGEAS